MQGKRRMVKGHFHDKKTEKGEAKQSKLKPLRIKPGERSLRLFWELRSNWKKNKSIHETGCCGMQ